MLISTSKPILMAIIIIVLQIAGCPFSIKAEDENLTNVEKAYGLFNERGYLESNSYSFDGVASVNDFNGNLMYTKILKYIPTTQNGIHQELKLIYNGSVGHFTSTHKVVPFTPDDRDFSISAPEWIISLNGYALQLLNFENDAVAFARDSDGPDYISKYNNVSLLVNGYHFCYAESGSYWRVFLLREDGSVQQFIKSSTIQHTVYGKYLTLDKNDRTKGLFKTIEGSNYFEIFREDGTKVLFREYLAEWKVDLEGNSNLRMLLPVEFSDRFGNTISVEYATHNPPPNDNSRIYGRPVLTSVGDFRFNWGELMTTGTYMLEISTESEGTLYTCEIANLEAYELFPPQVKSVSTTGNYNRALILSITDVKNRSEYFGYLPYLRTGDNLMLSDELYLGNLADYWKPMKFRLNLWRLSQIQTPSGGITKYTYANDSSTEWTKTPYYNTLSTNYPHDSLDVDFLYSGDSYHKDCGDKEHYPCYISDAFPTYGRDPYFVNMVTAKTRLSVIEDDTILISHDSIIYAWYDYLEDKYITSNDSFYTSIYRGAIGYDPGNNSCSGLVKDVFTYTHIYNDQGLREDLRDGSWINKLWTHSTYRPLEDCGWVRKAQEQKYWDEDELWLDSLVSYLDGKRKTVRYEYEYMKPECDTIPVNGDTMVNLVRTTYYDPLGIKTITYFNRDYFESEEDCCLYNNVQVDSIVVEADSILLSKNYNEFYDGTSSGGYCGQISKNIDLLINDSIVTDSCVTEYYYLKNGKRPRDNGAVKKVVDPEGYTTDYYYYTIQGDPESVVLDKTLNVISGNDILKKDSAEVEYLGIVKYDLNISGSNGDQGTIAQILLNGELISQINNCHGECSKYGEFEVTTGDSIKVVSNVARHDLFECNAAATARIYIYTDSLYNAVEYFKYMEDGQVDTTADEFQNNGPFWYKMVTNLNDDSLVSFRLVDSMGQPKYFVNPNGILSQIEYDEIQRVSSIVLPYNFDDAKHEPTPYTLKLEYDDYPEETFGARVKNYLKINDTTDDKTTYTYFDSFWRNAKNEYWSNQGAGDHDETTQNYDFLDRIDTSIDQSGYKTTFNYDQLGRIKRTTFPDSIHSFNIAATQNYLTTTFAIGLPDYPYDVPEVNDSLWMTSRIDENGHKSIQYFDANDQKRATRMYTGTYPDNSEYSNIYYDYDDLGNLITVQKPMGDECHYRYNSMGWLTETWSADRDTLVFKYDNNGNIISRKMGILSDLDSTFFSILTDSVIAEADSIEYSDVNSYTVLGCGHLKFHLYIYDPAKSGNTNAFIRINDCTVGAIGGDPDIGEMSLYDSCHIFVDSGDIITVGAESNYGEPNAIAISTAYIYVDSIISHWIYTNYDPLNRVYESGLVKGIKRQHNPSAEILDTLSINPVNYFIYDQRNSSNAQGRLSIAYSNQNGYKYGERYRYDARGRTIGQTNYFNTALDSTLIDSTYILLEKKAGCDTANMAVEKNGYVYYRLERCASQSLNTWLKIQKNDTTLEMTVYSPPCDTIIDSILCSAGDKISIIARIEPGVDTIWTDLLGVASYQRFDSPQKYLTGSNSYEIEYEYNYSDQLTEITYPDGMVVKYSYDDRGRLVAVGDSLTADRYAAITYTARNEVASLILGGIDNPVQTIDYDYNARGWLNSINDGTSEIEAPSDLFGEQLYYYGYSPEDWQAYYNGNIMAQELSFANGFGDYIKYQYQYDDLDRLTGVRSYGNVPFVLIDSMYEDFTYDKNGNFEKRYSGWNNMESSFLDSLVYQYDAGMNQVTRVTSEAGKGFVYDGNGNLCYDSARGIAFHYDIINQLDTAFFIDNPDSNYIAFAYNADGLRVYRDYHYTYWDSCNGNNGGDVEAARRLSTVNSAKGASNITVKDGGDTLCQYLGGKLTRYIRENPGGKVLAEYNDDQPRPCKFKYVYAGNQRIAFYDEFNRLHFYLNDHLGSARLVTDSAGNIKDKYPRYFAFGQTLSEDVSTDQKHRYTGKPFDDEGLFDLYYYGARYYDPVLGRFTALDPKMGSYPGLSPYAYCANNPVNSFDPNGEWLETAADILSVGLSVKDFYNDPSWANAGWLLLDVVCAVAPLVPAAGLVRHAGKIDNVVKSADKISDAAKAGGKVGDAASGSVSTSNVAEAGIKIEQHHMLPVEFKDYFSDAGLDIENYKMLIPEDLHRLKAGDGIHTKAGGNWNKQWKAWIKENPEPDPEKILQHLEELTKEFSRN